MFQQRDAPDLSAQSMSALQRGTLGKGTGPQGQSMTPREPARRCLLKLQRVWTRRPNTELKQACNDDPAWPGRLECCSPCASELEAATDATLY